MINAQGEQGYLDMMAHILATGVDKEDRTGTGTREIFGAMLRYDLSDGTVPLYTTKRIAWKTAIKEMLWMLSGSGNIRPLLQQNVHIWTEWPHARYVRETGDAIDMKTFEARIVEDEAFAELWGDTGGAYGVQWRSWPTFEPVGDGLFKPGPGVDQIQQIIDDLRTNPNSRRMIFSAWNPPRIAEMMLPPCHMTYQFQTQGDLLNLSMVIRSSDVFLGRPFNDFLAGVLLRMMAMHTGHQPGEVVSYSVATHIYSNHFDQVHEQLSRTPRPAPKLEIAPRDDFFDHAIEDFAITGYNPHPGISAPVAV